MIPVLAPEHRWECPNCGRQHVTREAQPHTPMHHCPGFARMWIPFVPAGVKAKVELVERGDYVRDELVRTDENGKPWMATVITRDDGQDCAVYAPTARGSLHE